MRARVAVAAGAVLSAVLLAGCGGRSGDTGGSGGSAPADGTTSSGAVTVTRWWSNSAASSGSAIDMEHPTALAEKLHRSQTDYCGMLRDTVSAGRSVLSSAAGNNPAVAAATEAFLAELQRVAPEAVAGPWHTLAGVVQALVEAGGDATKVKGIDTKGVQRAATAISRHAARTCHVDVSSVSGS